MGKKFDVVIGNPPYQDEAKGDATNQMPIYHHFMEAAYEVGEKAVLITPARFLFNAGYTPKAWNSKMLHDPHLKVSVYEPDSKKIFPGPDIKGGIAVTYRDDSTAGQPIGMFTKFPELNGILHRVLESGAKSIVTIGISNDRVYKYTKKMHEENPDAEALMSGGNKFKIDSKAFTRLADLYHSAIPHTSHEYSRVLGLGANKARTYRWIRRDYITGPTALGKFKIAVSKASGSGHFGEILSTPVVLEPHDAVTGTFITIGAFDSHDAAQACETYVKTKFARTMLGVLKVTQDNLARVWEYVPLQDFTSASDIDWSKSIAEVDQQLYAKYGLDAEEIEFIESHVKPME